MVVVLASGARGAGAQPSATTPTAQAALAEAKLLGAQVAELAKQGKFAEAVPLAEQSLSAREKELGPMHLDVAASLNSLGDLYWELAEYKKAEPLFVRALDIREKALGPMHPGVAESLASLANTHASLGAYAKALPLFVRALDIREKALGPMHPDVAETLSDFAGLYLEQGAYAKAEPLLVRALDIREKVLGPLDPEVANSLNNLAGVYWEQGFYAKAEPLFVRSLELRERVLGPAHPDVATSLNSLGFFYFTQGAYAKAQPLLVRALDIRERVMGPMHPTVAISLLNLGNLYTRRGAYAKAEPLYLRALDIDEKTLGPMHPKVATSLNTLASLYTEQGAYEPAEPLYLRALEIREKALGPMHPDVAVDLNNLAWLYVEQGAYRKAEPRFLRALDILEKSVGPRHPSFAACLSNLATIYADRGEYAKAESMYLRALGIVEKALGTMHPDVAKYLYGLARLYRARHAPEKAQPMLSRAVELREAQLRTELGRLSEPNRRSLMTTLRNDTSSTVSFHVDEMPTSARALELALTTVLRRKGRILDSLAETQATLRGHLTAGLRAQLDALAKARTELSQRLYSPPDLRGAGDRAAAIAAIRARVEGLEAALGSASLDFRAQAAPITVAKVQAELPRGAILVEFVRYQRFAPGRMEQRSQPDRYVAYLVTRQGPPRWVALGDAAPIDAAVDAALAVLHGAATTQATRAALQALDELVFAPVRAQLTGISHVILAPDSKLNLVPFEALVDPQGHYEIEQRLISYVTSGRDLLRLAAPHAPRSPAVIVASPDYGPPPSSAIPGTVAFAPLPGATAEVDALRRLFPTAPVTGAMATKRALAALTGPAILHVATHGFYRREAAAAPSQPAPISASAGASSPPLAQRGMYLNGVSRTQPQAADDPLDGLDQAGLAMAGANRGAEGIVTAREIAGFDWWGTKLVVLSACETGVGAVPSGDGVYGLRRAVVLAGAEAQVVSLWNVNDSSAQDLMPAYYDELTRGAGRAEALRQAKLRLLREPRYSHPHYWAAFILAGDWTPLDKRVLLPRSTP
ncbi:MAG TPA: CHAT domain-containing tetratricopeptide repeat protein [Kofleriaceae bacterium]|nr:CHAT domain-containing tetratricopeptide repeat protein [Kofleriaceae bacterium]